MRFCSSHRRHHSGTCPLCQKAKKNAGKQEESTSQILDSLREEGKVKKVRKDE